MIRTGKILFWLSATVLALVQVFILCGCGNVAAHTAGVPMPEQAPAVRAGAVRLKLAQAAPLPALVRSVTVAETLTNRGPYRAVALEASPDARTWSEVARKTNSDRDNADFVTNVMGTTRTYVFAVAQVGPQLYVRGVGW